MKVYRRYVSVLKAVYAFSAHYHSGQSSRGYRLSCMAQRALRRHYPNTVDMLGKIEHLIKHQQGHSISLMYNQLVRDYADKV